MDVDTSFSRVDEENMDQLEGFVAPGQENKACILLKSLYGLPQAPKEWHQKFGKVIESSFYS